MKRFSSLLGALAFVVFGLVSTEVISSGGAGFGPGSRSITVRSGEMHRVGSHWASTMNNGPVPYKVTLSEPPKHGTVSLRQEANKTVIYYQSRKGYVGLDSFKYVRVSNDRFGGTYDVAVTVR